MKPNLLFIISGLLLMSNKNVDAQASSYPDNVHYTYNIKSWNLADAKKTGTNDGDYKVYSQNYEIDVRPDQRVELELAGLGDTVKAYIHPGEYDESITNDRKFGFSLDEGSSFLIKLVYTQSKEKRINVLLIRISTTRPINRRGNPSFLFVSGIRSIGNENYDNQWVDLNLKKNLLKGRMFLLMSTDLSLKKDEEKDSLSLNQTQLVEAGMSFNHFLMYENTYNLNNKLNRTAFLGGGIKIFNQQPMAGVHIGVMEVNGPLFTSYTYAGYYCNLYDLPDVAHRDSGGANIFRHNLYLESALMIDPGSQENEFLQSLSRVRIKIGVLFPLGKETFLHPTKTGETQKFKPLMNDVQYRVVMEIPLGKIFRF